ncbi:hypothetical protein [Isoptericola croceus]|uniref:hypothetical protein n=1 Tax=Isoptericola croceus TaxID=3031406 RepID=UPI0023F6FB8E|nr:hypothetical protein [Isoptericola croceus]
MWIYAALLYVALSVPLALLSRKLDAAMRKRAGLQTVPAGEIEACQVLSVSRFDTAGLLYLAITIPTTWLVGFTERRMSRHLVRTS